MPGLDHDVRDVAGDKGRDDLGQLDEPEHPPDHPQEHANASHWGLLFELPGDLLRG
jgi:hypothetical protein